MSLILSLFCCLFSALSPLLSFPVALPHLQPFQSGVSLVISFSLSGHLLIMVITSPYLVSLSLVSVFLYDVLSLSLSINVTFKCAMSLCQCHSELSVLMVLALSRLQLSISER